MGGRGRGRRAWAWDHERKRSQPSPSVTALLLLLLLLSLRFLARWRAGKGHDTPKCVPTNQMGDFFIITREIECPREGRKDGSNQGSPGRGRRARQGRRPVGQTGSRAAGWIDGLITD